MQTPLRVKLIHQAASHLRRAIASGDLVGKLPGVWPLAAQYGVSHTTLRAALVMLEGEGLVTPGVAGRCREVVSGKFADNLAPRRVMILLSVALEREDAGFQLVLSQLRREIEAGGYVCEFAAKSLDELHHSLPRIQRLVASRPADAWVVVGGMQEALRWFATQPIPAFAIGGRRLDLPIAGVGVASVEAFRLACRRLIELGHRRIVFVSPRGMRQPEPARYLQILAEELSLHDVAFGSYHVPDWEETPAGLVAMLEGCFRLTPPTALIVLSTNWLLGTLAFLSRRRLLVPEDVSVVCMNHDALMDWIFPVIAHFRSNEYLMIGEVLRWLDTSGRTREIFKAKTFQAEFVPGESIRPPRG